MSCRRVTWGKSYAKTSERLRNHTMRLICSLASLSAALVFCACAGPAPSSVEFTSPAGSLRAILEVDSAGRLFYHLADSETGRLYVERSRLGFRVAAGADGGARGITSGHAIAAVVEQDGRSSYELSSGKQVEVDKPFVGRVVYLDDAAAGPDARAGAIEWRLYDDGLAFRYLLTSDYDSSSVIAEEFTEFVLPKGLTAYRQDYDTVTVYSPGYEQFWDRVGVSDEGTDRGFVFPLYAFDDDRHVLLHEGPIFGGNPGSHLVNEGHVYRLTAPRPTEAKGLYPVREYADETPWRIIVAGATPQIIAATTLPTDVAPERHEGDWSWVEPGRASWSWWSDWDSPQDYDKLRGFVDFAAEQGWSYSLVDANWNEMKGGTLAGLAAYAKTREVDLLVWYNSGGPHNEVTEAPRDRMHERERRRAEMARLQEMGVRGIKVDFFQSDKPEIMRQYIGILEDGADYELMINFHGCTVPRGLRRTYPNLLTAEAVVGAESYHFKKGFAGRAPVQNTILPLTRNAVGPMDYTPVALTVQKYPRLTTDGHELALALLFESGLLHYADDTGAYEALPDFAKDYLAEVPVTWDEVRHLDGVPGEYIALARRKGDEWWVAAINGTDEPQRVTFAITEPGTPMAVIVDGNFALPGTPAASESTQLVKTDIPTRTIVLPPYGGMVGWTP